MRPEAKLQKRVCEYLQDKYPNVIFHSDLSAGMSLSIGQAVQNKKLQFSNGLPDLYILEPMVEFHKIMGLPTLTPRNYSGLLLELKADGVSIYLKDGITLRKDDHLAEQWRMLVSLREKGYKAEFGLGYEATIKIIDEYLGT